jgi:2,5-diketo-D-gluconate reductase B
MPPEPLPAPGFGTSGLEGKACIEAVGDALETGYRHVDTAQMYDNEREVGEAIADSAVDREAVFLATKIHPGSLAPEDVRETARASLDRLGVEQVDLLYVHWPTRAYDADATLPAFDAVYEAGLTRRVGVSNFSPELLAEARGILDAPVFAHQVECHPLLPQTELLELARETDHHLVAYSPLARGEIFDHPVVESVAADLGASPAQVVIAWNLDRGVVPIPKARGAHVAENFAAREIELTGEARRRLDAIEDRNRIIDPKYGPWNAQDTS